MTFLALPSVPGIPARLPVLLPHEMDEKTRKQAATKNNELTQNRILRFIPVSMTYCILEPASNIVRTRFSASASPCQCDEPQIRHGLITDFIRVDPVGDFIRVFLKIRKKSGGVTAILFAATSSSITTLYSRIFPMSMDVLVVYGIFARHGIFPADRMTEMIRCMLSL
jgi:hypothetical protein